MMCILSAEEWVILWNAIRNMVGRKSEGVQKASDVSLLWVSLPPAQHLSSLSLHLSSEQISRHSATAAKEITSSAVVATFLGITGAFHAGVCGFEIETTKLENAKALNDVDASAFVCNIYNKLLLHVRTYVRTCLSVQPSLHR